MKNTFESRNYIIAILTIASLVFLLFNDSQLGQVLSSLIGSFFLYLINIIYQHHIQSEYKKKKSNLFNKFNKKKLINLYKLHPHSTIEKIKNLYRKAEEYEINEQYNQALHFLEQALKHNSDPKFIKSQLPLLYTEGKIKEVIELSIQRKFSSKEERIENLGFLAICYKKIKCYEKSKECLTKISEYYTDDQNEKIICLIDLLECHLSLEEKEEEYKLLEKINELIVRKKYYSGIFYLLNTYISYYLVKEDPIYLLKHLSISASLLNGLNKIDLDLSGSAAIISIYQFLEQSANALAKHRNQSYSIVDEDINIDEILKYVNKNPEKHENNLLLKSIIESFKIQAERYLDSMEI
ncbi:MULTISPECIES: hypothetical protein [Leptospira]|uniref:Tetratricopeptide repeat protein n=1 Tax=Leptospira limi TaxID=2950023 RepID=A0ABT3M323_9LEPT|nr:MULTISPECIES: hypothetical protein [Leptospira]MCW7463998.1 hypothetical protein [Leptospira limi]TGK92562.1 hypothetical protein EHQ34_18280 [Leptospira levettii]